MFLFIYFFNNFSFFFNTFLVFFLLYLVILLIIHIKRGLFSILYDYIKMPQSYEFLNKEFNLLLVLLFLEFVLFKFPVL